MHQRFTYEEITATLRSHDLKVTQQRIIVYEALLSIMNHPTAEQIYELVKPANPTISLATVYKTLDTFSEVGLAKKVLTKEGTMRYDGDMEKHHHIHCTNTDEIIDYKDTELISLVKDYFSKKNIHNLTISDISVQINGEKLDLGKSIEIK